MTEARKILGMSLGMGPKDRTYKAYIEVNCQRFFHTVIMLFDFTCDFSRSQQCPDGIWRDEQSSSPDELSSSPDEWSSLYQPTYFLHK